MKEHNAKELAQTLFEEAGDALFLFDTDSEQIVDINPMAQRLSGHARSELIGMHITHLFRSEGKGSLHHLRQAFQRTGIFHSQEGFYLRRQQKDSWVPVNLTITRLHIRPKPLGLITARDITERKEWEDELRRNENRFRSLVENGMEAISLLSAKGIIQYASPSARRILGYPIEELVGSDASDFIHPDDRARIEAQFDELVAQPGKIVKTEFCYRHQNGSWIHLEVTSQNRLDDPCVQAVVANYRDITERKQAERALRDSEERYRQLFERNLSGVVSTRLDGAILECNDAFARILGYDSRAEVLACRTQDFYLNPAGRPLIVDRLRENGAIAEHEHPMRRKDGSTVWVLASTILLEGQDGQPVIQGSIHDITERISAEAALRQAEEKYRTIFENAAEGIYQTTVDGRFLTANPKLAHIYGCQSPEELLSNLNNTENHFYAEPRRRAEFIRLMREQQSVTNFESLISRKDGKSRWISENAHTVRSAEGLLIGYEGTVVDITERKEAEEAVARERYLLHSLMDNVPDGIYFKDHESRFLRVNLALAKKFNLPTPAEALAKSDGDFFAPEHSRATLGDEQKVMSTGQPLIGKEEMETWPDGRVTWVSTTKLPLQDSAGRTMGTFGISRDITESKRAEQALRDSEARYRSLIENMVQGVYLKSLDLRYRAVNKPFCQTLGLTAESILGKSDFDLFSQEQADKYVAADHQVLVQGHGLEVEEDQICNGVRRVIRTFKTPVKDNRGQVVGVQGILWDVTERRALEEQLRQSQKMEAVGQLAGGVAHDFNNLLTAILGNISLVQDRLPRSSQEVSLLEVAEKAALRAAELTRQLLGFSRRTLLRPEPICLNLAIEDTVRILQRTIDPRIGVEIRLASDLWTVRADPSQVNQVLMNLCLNARDAMPQGGRLVLQTENVVLNKEEARLKLSAHAGEFVRLRVEDSGIGMTAETRAHIFEPFFTTKEPGKGTGLGLAMVFGIVQQHQGWIDCHSEIHQGARFDIYMPRHHQAVPTMSKSAAPIPGRGGETVLVVDDEVMIRNLARDILQKFGYQVILAEDGQQAVEIFAREHEQIDLVILDLTMPRMSGRDALRGMVAVNAEVRALLSSGFSADPSLMHHHPQVLGFVSKPYRPEDLARAVRAALDRSRGSNQARNLVNV